MQKLNPVSISALLILAFLSFCSGSISQINWVTKTPLPNLLTECGSVTLNGKIHIIGGLEPGGVSTTKVHVYDPIQNSWSLAAPLPMAMHHMACAIANGKIYVLGGYTSNPFQPVNNTYEYDPVANNWIPKAPVPTIRGAAAAAELDGKIYVIGGAGFNLLQSNDINEVYDPVTNTWETKTPMPTARDHHTVVTLDTLIYSVGGRNFSINIGSNRVVEAYSPSENKWYLMDSLFWTRSGFSLVVVDEKIYAIGGEWFTPGGSGLTAQIEVYDPMLNNWEYFGNMNTTRHGLGAGAVGDTIYTISGGLQAGFSYSDVNEAFVPEKSIGIQQISEIANDFTLSQNYPNPFNPVTKIRFNIPGVGWVSLKIYDMLGRAITILINMQLTSGSYEVNWNASNQPSGIYFYELSFNESKLTSKMVVLK